MQTDQSTDSATVTTRRAFLTRTAVGGALAAGAVALPLSALMTSAGAQEGGTLKDLEDFDYVAFAGPLELAAVQAYTTALNLGTLDSEWTAHAQQFQANHQSIADGLVTVGDPNAAAPIADVAFAKTANDAIRAAGDQNGVLLALSNVEDTLAATHLAAVRLLLEESTAKTATQILTTEGQQAALLAVAAGTPVAEVTPPTSTADAALTITTTTTTTSTTAAN
ncbi:ferritin-like domain-containing protein [Aquihabitans sp. McL0605]|uniref:ferritin-like domain-containing protein n=1 Tax=Aquihabitans sp. McL0605 TaxID=3415671 RepID=UPI003CF04F09